MFFFFNDTATTEIYTLSLHDALPIYRNPAHEQRVKQILQEEMPGAFVCASHELSQERSEEHTSELQSHSDLVCRLLLEKKKPLKSPRPRGASREQTPRDLSVGNAQLP